MADEISVTFALQYTNGTLKDSVASETKKITQTTQMLYGALVSVGTSEEDLALGDINASNGCYVYLKNVDSTNFVKFGPKDTTMTEFGRLYAGQSAWFFLAPSVTLRWVSDTASCKVLVKAYEK